MPRELIQLCSGKSYKLLAFGQEVLTFIRTECSDKDRKKLIALLDRTAELGPPKNELQFKLLEDGIYEFKAGQARLTCFFDRNRLIICPHGFTKKRQKTRKRDIEKAKELRAKYREETKNENHK